MDMLNYIKSKILSDNTEINRKIAYWKFLNQKIVFTNGCFDFLHQGHIEYLAKAASMGDILVIGLNTDRSVKSIKGNNRPINDETARAMVLAGMGFVEAVILFDEDTPFELIKKVEPDILVKGSDYEKNEVVGSDIVLEKGGEVKTVELTDGFSSTDIIDRIKKI